MIKKAKRLKELFRFSMDGVEERSLQQYLKNIGDNDPVGYEYLVLFLLSRSRYTEAIECFNTHLAPLVPNVDGNTQLIFLKVFADLLFFRTDGRRGRGIQLPSTSKQREREREDGRHH